MAEEIPLLLQQFQKRRGTKRHLPRWGDLSAEETDPRSPCSLMCSLAKSCSHRVPGAAKLRRKPKAGERGCACEENLHERLHHSARQSIGQYGIPYGMQRQAMCANLFCAMGLFLKCRLGIPNGETSST